MQGLVNHQLFLKRLLTKKQRILLKYQKSRVAQIGMSADSEELDSERYNYSNTKKDLRLFDRELTNFSTETRLERNLLYGLISRGEIQRDSVESESADRVGNQQTTGLNQNSVNCRGEVSFKNRLVEDKPGYYES